MRRRLRKLLLILGIVGVVLLGIVGAGLILLTSIFSSIAEHGWIVPQDCNGTAVHLSGIVHSISGAEVTVAAGDLLQGESGAVHFTLITDANGEFDSGSGYIPIFICEMMIVNISAKGFETQQITYSFFDHFSEDDLAASIKSGQPLPVHLEIELQPVE